MNRTNPKLLLYFRWIYIGAGALLALFYFLSICRSEMSLFGNFMNFSYFKMTFGISGIMPGSPVCILMILLPAAMIILALPVMGKVYNFAGIPAIVMLIFHVAIFYSLLESYASGEGIIVLSAVSIFYFIILIAAIAVWVASIILARIQKNSVYQYYRQTGAADPRTGFDPQPVNNSTAGINPQTGAVPDQGISSQAADPVKTFCPQCGEALAPGSRFCSRCGAQVSADIR